MDKKRTMEGEMGIKSSDKRYFLYQQISWIFSKKSFWRNQKLQPSNSQHRSTHRPTPARFVEGQKKTRSQKWPLVLSGSLV